MVEFDIEQVPKYYTPYNDNLYLSGNFNNWIPNGQSYKFQKISKDRYQIRINLDIGYYQYKITRGKNFN